jgi:coenzyme F420-0:L-glutamate ligase / coenzyme F420-1:gamma-L-glutamate ligase
VSAPQLTVWAPDGVGEVREGDDLATLLLAALGDSAELADGDIVAVTSKVVSKAEGSIVAGTRDDALPGETRRVVARRGGTAIVRNRLGLTLAAAGIDASNVAPGHVVLHPRDPDASARELRAALHARTGRVVGVIVTDTAGRAWRDGQTDIAIGAAGVEVLESFVGRTDAYGNDLVVTAPAVVDELAGLAELATGKLGGRPFAVVRGRADLVLPAGADGPGAAALIREEGRDFFGYGAREAVLRAVGGADGDHVPFGSPVSAEELTVALDQIGVAWSEGSVDDATIEVHGLAYGVVRVLAFALGWDSAPTGVDLVSLLRPKSP